jgi:hypothetical protein
VDVDPERLAAWLNRFAVRHGGYRVTGADDALHLEAEDRTTLQLWPAPGASPPGRGAVPTDRDAVEEFVIEAMRDRRVGLLLARQASVAVGIAAGPALVTSKVDTFYVQSRTAAGGWSQQRYARRRSNQARAAAEGAVEVAVRLLLAEVASLAALVTGGDRRTVDAILTDQRLAPLAPLVAQRFLSVGEPRRATLENAVRLARQVRVLVRDPPGSAGAPS